MKKLVFASLFCVIALQLGTGCIIVGDDDDDEVLTSSIDVTWELLEGDLDDPATVAAVPCPPAGTIELVIVRGDGSTFLAETFDCTSDGALISEVELGSYGAHINLYAGDPSPANLIARSDQLDAGVIDTEIVTQVAFELTVDHGRFGIGWDITVGGAATTCADVAGDTALLRSTSVLDNLTFPDLFPCDEGEGVTSFLPLGDYTIQLLLQDDLGDAIGLPQGLDGSIDIATDVTDLGIVTVEL